MNVLYIGKFFPSGILRTISYDSKGKIGMSNHNFEMSIINGLCQQEQANLRCLSLPAVYSFPYNNKRFFTRAESYDYKGIPIRSIGFCNLPVIKEVWSTIGLIFQIIKSISYFSDNRVDIIINTPNNCILNSVRLAKFFTRKHITQTVIIPDIPSMVTTMDKRTN